MRRKLIILYIIFVVIPIVLFDSFIFTSIYHGEEADRQHQMEDEANAIRYTFFNQVNQAAKLGNAFYTSYYIDGFLTHEYESNLDYYNSYKQFFDDTLVHLVTGQNALNFCIYLKNDTITNGAEFQQLSKAKGTKWYEYVVTSQMENGLFFDNIVNVDGKIQRKIYFFQRLNYYDYNSPNILLITLDYTKCCEYLENLNFEDKAYICDENRVLISNGTYSNVGKYYEDVNDLKSIKYTQDFLVYGQDLTIKINDESSTFLEIMRKRWFQLLFMVILNIALPLFVSSLMHMNFKNKLKEQEMVVARKNAELLALHSQINPHFLFNALESIRMHSLLKQETETARMVEHLAKLQRQYTEWEQDSVRIDLELEFVEAYLQLQKYRFGDRLSFEIDVDDECKELMLPKLTIVTFVENACVHGIESKTTPGWIFVRLSIKDENLILEIEDTGNGMPEVGVKLLLQKMRDANIDMLKSKGRVGIINACLRLKMLTENQVTFDLDSEIGTGTLVQISIPVKYLKGKI